MPRGGACGDAEVIEGARGLQLLVSGGESVHPVAVLAGPPEPATDVRVAGGERSQGGSCPCTDGGRERGGLARSSRHCQGFSLVMLQWEVRRVEGVFSRAEPSLPAVPVSR